MLRLVFIALTASACRALAPVPRRALLSRFVAGAAALPAAAPLVAGARSAYEMEMRSSNSAADGDMKGLLGSFTSDLADKEKAKEAQKAVEALPLQDRLLLQGKKAAAAVDARPAPGVATVPKKTKKPRKFGYETEDEYKARLAETGL